MQVPGQPGSGESGFPGDDVCHQSGRSIFDRTDRRAGGKPMVGISEAGVTTFSTFSLETVQLLEKGRLFTGVGYAVVSVVACLTGVVLGMAAASLADHV